MTIKGGEQMKREFILLGRKKDKSFFVINRCSGRNVHEAKLFFFRNFDSLKYPDLWQLRLVAVMRNLDWHRKVK